MSALLLLALFSLPVFALVWQMFFRGAGALRILLFLALCAVLMVGEYWLLVHELNLFQSH